METGIPRPRKDRTTDYLPQGLPLSGAALAPDIPAVFSIQAGDQSVYLARTSALGRRLRRVMKLWNLAQVAAAIEYWPTHSRLEAALYHYFAARRLYGEGYQRRIRLRSPAYVKLLLGNRFPRLQVTSRLTGGRALFYGPFRTRAAAETFATACLDLFQLRRCQDDLVPSPDHPGCVYGEMNLCLRPCQQICSEEEYASEAARLADFLHSDGAALLRSARSARDRLSEEMNFEEAARQHRRVENIEATLALRGELARELTRLHGVAILPGEGGAVKLWFMVKGWWQAPRQLRFLEAGLPVDAQLKQVTTSLSPVEGTLVERQEHLAILAGWRFSRLTDGEWLPFDDFSSIPYRRFANAVARVRKGGV